MALVDALLAAVLAALDTEDRAQLTAYACKATDEDDDKNVFKLAAKLLPILQEALKDPAVLAQIKGIKGTFAMTVLQDGKPAGSWCVKAMRPEEQVG